MGQGLTLLGYLVPQPPHRSLTAGANGPRDPGTPAHTHSPGVRRKKGGPEVPRLLLDLRICTPRPHAPGLWVTRLGSGGEASGGLGVPSPRKGFQLHS